jgi:hypothetical protein
MNKYLSEKEKRQIYDHLYFIALIDQSDMYLHVIKDTAEGDHQYEVRPGRKGAGMWFKYPGKRFIKESGYNNLQLVKCTSV